MLQFRSQLVSRYLHFASILSFEHCGFFATLHANGNSSICFGDSQNCVRRSTSSGLCWVEVWEVWLYEILLQIALKDEQRFFLRFSMMRYHFASIFNWSKCEGMEQGLLKRETLDWNYRIVFILQLIGEHLFLKIVRRLQTSIFAAIFHKFSFSGFHFQPCIYFIIVR